jgi:hypothetical protein
MSNPSDKEPAPTSTGAQDPKVESPEAAQVKEPSEKPEQMAALLERLDKQSAVINRLQKAYEKLSVAPVKEKDEKPVDGKANEYTQLVKDMAELKAKEARAQARAAKTSIKAELMKAGLHDAFIDDQTDILHVRNADRIKVDDEGNATFDDGVEAVPLSTWVQSYVQSDKGRAYLKPKANPSVQGMGRSQHPSAGTLGVRTVTRDDLRQGKVSPDDILSGKAKVG